jgi:hypothetical protein
VIFGNNIWLSNSILFSGNTGSLYTVTFPIELVSESQTEIEIKNIPSLYGVPLNVPSDVIATNELIALDILDENEIIEAKSIDAQLLEEEPIEMNIVPSLPVVCVCNSLLLPTTSSVTEEDSTSIDGERALLIESMILSRPNIVIGTNTGALLWLDCIKFHVVHVQQLDQNLDSSIYTLSFSSTFNYLLTITRRGHIRILHFQFQITNDERENENNHSNNSSTNTLSNKTLPKEANFKTISVSKI